MKNETCGNCKYFNGLAHGFCKNKQGRLSVQMNDPICRNYKQKPTNGDKIRQLSNEELAERFGIHAMCDFCPAETADCQDGHSIIRRCKANWLNYLNAPAESEVESE